MNWQLSEVDRKVGFSSGALTVISARIDAVIADGAAEHLDIKF
ncbi:hypothetical protein [Posidoniimonas polymericola]|nr:hypothetical protein [Posidoniimonas polymericola]